MKTTLISRAVINLAFVISLLISLPSLAKTYQVEITVLSNDSGAAKREQTWPITSVSYPNSPLMLLTNQYDTPNNIQLISANSTNTITTIPLLGSSNYQHQNIINALTRSGQKSVLFHQVWMLPIKKLRFAQAIVIEGGKVRNNISELGGTIKLYTITAPENLIPSIHITTALWRIEFTNSPNNLTNDWSVPEKFPTTLPSMFSLRTTHIDNINSIATLTGDEIINRNKLHYIDGPRFSVLLEIRAQ